MERVCSGGGCRPPPQDQRCAQRWLQQCFKVFKVTSKASLSPAGTGLMLSDEVLSWEASHDTVVMWPTGNNKRLALLGKDFISSSAWKDLAPTGR